jgi:hypothetical protein
MLLFRVDRHRSDQPSQHAFGSSGYAILHIIGLSFSYPGHHGYLTRLLTPASPSCRTHSLHAIPKTWLVLPSRLIPVCSHAMIDACLHAICSFISRSTKLTCEPCMQPYKPNEPMHQFFLISSSLHVAPPSSIVLFHALICHVSPHGSPACLCSMHDANGFSRHVHPHEFPFPCGCTCSPTLPSLPNFIHNICPPIFRSYLLYVKKHLVSNDF